jgi:hypothetical protein
MKNDARIGKDGILFYGEILEKDKEAQEIFTAADDACMEVRQKLIKEKDEKAEKDLPRVATFSRKLERKKTEGGTDTSIG